MIAQPNWRRSFSFYTSSNTGHCHVTMTNGCDAGTWLATHPPVFYDRQLSFKMVRKITILVHFTLFQTILDSFGQAPLFKKTGNFEILAKSLVWRICRLCLLLKHQTDVRNAPCTCQFITLRDDRHVWTDQILSQLWVTNSLIKYFFIKLLLKWIKNV